MTSKRYYRNNNNLTIRKPDPIPASRNGAQVYVVMCLCGMTQRIILSKYVVKECVNRLIKCHHSFYLNGNEICIGGLQKS